MPHHNTHEILTKFFERHESNKPNPVFGSRAAEDVIRNTDHALPFLILKLSFSIPVEKMFDEAMALRRAFIPHRASENHSGWKSLSIHGISSAHIENHTQYGFNTAEEAPYRWTDIATLCPISTEFFRDTFNYFKYERIRFMWLDPGGYIVPHTDKQSPYLSATNIALNNPTGCKFVMAGAGILPFEPGSALLVGVHSEHAVWNRSNEPRIHMIVHGRVKDNNDSFHSHWRDTITQSWKRIAGD